MRVLHHGVALNTDIWSGASAGNGPSSVASAQLCGLRITDAVYYASLRLTPRMASAIITPDARYNPMYRLPSPKTLSRQPADRQSRRPAGRQDLGLLENRPRRRLLLVRRVAMLAQNALNETTQIGTDVLA